MKFSRTEKCQHVPALVCGGQMEQEGRSRMVEMSLVLVARSVEQQQRLLESQVRFLAGTCWHFFHPAELHLLRSFFFLIFIIFLHFIIYIRVIPSDACLSLGGRPLAIVL